MPLPWHWALSIDCGCPNDAAEPFGLKSTRGCWQDIAFQHTLTDYGQILRQEGGSITQAWTPNIAPDEWRQ